MTYFILTPNSIKQQLHPTVFNCKKIADAPSDYWLLKTDNFEIAEKVYRYLKQNYMTYNRSWFKVYYCDCFSMTTGEALEYYLQGKKIGIYSLNQEIKTHLIEHFKKEIDFDLVQWNN